MFPGKRERYGATSFFILGRPVMNEQPKLSDAEWALMTELLQREHHELPNEIHHTRVASYRKELHLRHEMVRSVLERLLPMKSQ